MELTKYEDSPWRVEGEENDSSSYIINDSISDAVTANVNSVLTSNTSEASARWTGTYEVSGSIGDGDAIMDNLEDSVA